jgi:PPOX class probable FMN-dependent enzyme
LLDRSIAGHAHLPFHQFAQLATTDAAGFPAVRTVRWHSFLGNCRVLLSADLRSEKVAHLAAQPVAELCWYFVESREQFRLRGAVQVVGAGATGELAELRSRCWQERTPQSRQAFTWPIPGEPRAADEAFAAAEPRSPPATFGLLVLDPVRVDYLDLRPHPHNRVVYRLAEGSWGRMAVNP